MGFVGIDPLGQRFHVLALRQTLTWDDTGQLLYADEQQPLCSADEFFGEMHRSSVRQESDLCHYKPKCDVVVNATAHAPRGEPTDRFIVGLRVSARQKLDAPARPYGLNPTELPTAGELRAWEADIARANQGVALIDKQLNVTGARTVQRQDIPKQGFIAGVRRLLDDPIPPEVRWELTAPQPLTELPLRYEYALGGECRINLGDAGAGRVPESQRLTEEQRAECPGGDDPDPLRRPIAYAVDESNRVGMGYSPAWFTGACGLTQIPAPQIEFLDEPLTVATWLQRSKGPTENTDPPGFGIRYRGHPNRRHFVGTVDEAFAQSDAPLPEDFDFAVYNCAPLDQQVESLAGNEILTLTNLCRSDTPGARLDTHGNTLLQLKLSGDLPFALVRFENGALGELAAKLDTLIIEPEERTVTCVWRAVMGIEPEVRVLEARMIAHQDIESLRHAEAARVRPPERDLAPEPTHG